ncbi:MAG TPA: class I SAM-dependent methyltransferase [Acidimicrobiales bacterium]|nr:class I SAM-dependent methyltransferase [Acidimicrobiales bacterium]
MSHVSTEEPRQIADEQHRGGLSRASSLEELSDQVAAALQEGEDSVDAALERLWRAHPISLEPLAAAVQVAPRLGLESATKWSARLRARGFESMCPLIAKATDISRSAPARVEAALQAWGTFFDDRARHILENAASAPLEPPPRGWGHDYPEIAVNVPWGARRVLDIGCAAGRLGASIRNRQPCEVIGIERASSVAAHASRVLDDVLVGDLEGDVLDQLTGTFDAIVAPDVLNRLHDPWIVVERLVARLSPGGVLVVSLANLANLGVVANLLNGRFDYREAGILDRSHLRFFTAATAAELLGGAGLVVEAIEFVRDAALPMVTLSEGSDTLSVSFGRTGISGIDAQLVPQLTAARLVLVGRVRAAEAESTAVVSPAGARVRGAFPPAGVPSGVDRPRTASSRLPRGAAIDRPTIWDCVLFFNELDLLEARLEELEGIVDHVVVVEADRTFRGDLKPLWFHEHRERFARHEDKLHWVVARLPEHGDAWLREKLQRDAAMQALACVKPEDLVLCCDVDEIVRRDAVGAIVEATMLGPVSLDMAMYYYSLDWRSPQTWRHPKALRGRDLPISIEALRMLGVHTPSNLPTVAKAGWHLSYFGGESRIHEKLESFSHAEYDTPQVHSVVGELIASGRTVHGIQLQVADDPFPPHLEQRFARTGRAGNVATVTGLPRRHEVDAPPSFEDQWYDATQLSDLVGLLRDVVAAGVDGEYVEIGCWEGRSTVELAKALAGSDHHLHAVDWWRGNLDEGTGHATVTALAERDVFGTFQRNVAPYPHVVVHRQDGGEFLEEFTAGHRLAFIHLDAGHTFAATRSLIDAALPYLAPGGIICGDDFQNSHLGRADLGGGVERAVLEAFRGEASSKANLWFYRRPAEATPAWWPAGVDRS